MSLDEKMMREALDLAGKGMGNTHPNPMVGALVVRDGRIIGRGWHHRAGEAHAEVNAVRDAHSRGGEVRGSTVYVTLEPCSSFGRTPPCTDLLIREGVSRVVVGCSDPNKAHAGRGFALLREAGIEVTQPVLEEPCRRLNRAFFKWIVERHPYVILKLAETLDGKIACANNVSQWITGPQCRARVQQLRRWADAVMVGGATARCDHPKLTRRDEAGRDLARQPLRFVASRSMTQEELTGLFDEPYPEVVPARSPEEWRSFFAELGARKILSVLVEGGGTLGAALLNAGVVDEVEFHIAPRILGGCDAIGSVGGASPKSPDAAWELDEVCWTPCGKDMIVNGKVVWKER
ncbi:MAG: bifunctional diaminohydroxyphosphoribosylaminopyrimidine deaminase/5-amino-6-(5-phosphoribosylamino)uracil reductase RibD [Victivallaceae bacterium]|nr:bifunctional diaminohydroxyphosphoribosylaminopyrimidine deaminase/5-amino-6-(5-phosphoribosylamino)uracil reductase RibD [Victivallaceae bacterium]